MKKLMAASFVTAVFLSLAAFGSVNAADLSKFDPGRIIDDAVFYNSSTMTAEQIQAFLNSKVPVCNTYTFGTSMHQAAPCLKDYRETTNTKSVDAFCDGYGEVNQSAAEIIYGVAQSCGVNPQVLIVILQKEQGLVTDTWPRDRWLTGTDGNGNYQYRSAMGYGCPDTAACDTVYYGFFNQVYYAARQFKRYQANPNAYSYRAGRNNNILWHPNSGCGYSTVYIENSATAGLYNYTPYRPNQAALNAGYGLGDGCSSYGNRNFYAYFVDWFGNTYAINYKALVTPRYLSVSAEDASKIDLNTGLSVNGLLEKGQEIFFVSETTYQDQPCFRSRYDQTYNNNYCIFMKHIAEINLDNKTIPEIRIATRSGLITKYNPVTEISFSAKYDNLLIATAQTFVFQGVDYYSSAYDVANSLAYGIKASEVIVIDPIPLRSMTVTEPSYKLSPVQLTSDTAYGELSRGHVIAIAAEVTIDDHRYYVSQYDYNINRFLMIDSNVLSEIAFEPFLIPRNLRVSKNTCKYNIKNKQASSVCYEAGEILYFKSKTYVDGKWWYRSNWETEHHTNLVIDPEALSEL